MRYDDQDEDRAPIGRRQKPARNNRAPARRSPAHNRKNEQDDDEWYDDPDRDLPDDEQDEEAYDDDHDELADDDDAEEQLMARRPSWKRRLLSLGLKLALVGIAVMALWGIYLDGKIRDRMDGQVWQLPASVYSRIINLQPGEPYSLKMMSEALEGMQYRP
ncbi:MAG: bifunctional glycosyl transferase/transpeptidase, partial [Plesiomonas shigelloides]